MTKRPELGELTPGQSVMVRRSVNEMRGIKPEDRYIPAVVVKAARVWVDLKRVGKGWPQSWRMRRDTQSESTRYSGSNASFATMEQHAWDETQTWARGVLKENGIRLDHQSPWKGREVELADLISKASSGDKDYVKEYGYDPGPTVLNGQGWPVPASKEDNRCA